MTPLIRRQLQAKLDEVESLSERLGNFASQIGKGSVSVPDEHEEYPRFVEMRNIFDRANADLDAFVRTMSKTL